MNAKNDDTSGVFDVAKPGQSRPDTTSRPIIVGHKSMVEDPMVTASASTSVAASKKDNDEQDSSLKSTEDKIAPHEAHPVSPLHETVAPEPPTPEPPTKPSEDNPKTSDSSAIQQAESDKKEKETETSEEKVSDEEKARQATVQKLIDDKQYVVHVGEEKRQRSKRILLLILGVGAVALLLIAWLLMSS